MSAIGKFIPKSGAEYRLDALKKSGVTVIMATGDSLSTAREGANKSYGTRAFTGNPLILND